MDIRRTDKIGSFHKLNEYMIKVDQYYKLQKMNGKNLYKAIYLASDDPALFEEAYKKRVKFVCFYYVIILIVVCFRYPDYYIFGNPELSKTGSVTTNELDKSILNINIDLYFLSQCDYLVCTFSSHVCEIHYFTKILTS